ELEARWFDFSAGTADADVGSAITSQLSFYYEDGRKNRDPLSKYFASTATNPFGGTDPQDVQFRGLVYTKKNFQAYIPRYNFEVNGALIASGGSVLVRGPKSIRTRYDANWVRNAVKNYEGIAGNKLDQGFWATR
ncbi:MAG: hypothetical protein AB1758_29195, partial [Candidatus Eremiobacterota bacterium]